LLALVETYKALGGGWNIQDNPAGDIPEPQPDTPPENTLPKPRAIRLEDLPLPSVREAK